MTGEIALSWNYRGSVQPHREDIIGVWVYIDCQSILHMFILSAIALNCVLDVRVAQVKGGSQQLGMRKE